MRQFELRLRVSIASFNQLIGCEESLARQEATRALQRVHLESLRKNVIRLEQKRQNLNAAYVDPEIGMRKAGYLAQKARLDDELKDAFSELETVEKELSGLPTTAELETLEAFAAQVSGISYQQRTGRPGMPSSSVESLRRWLSLLSPPTKAQL